jgi:hypothetical protein
MIVMANIIIQIKEIIVRVLAQRSNSIASGRGIPLEKQRLMTFSTRQIKFSADSNNPPVKGPIFPAQRGEIVL